jgi:hypothetical protein
MRFFQIGLSAGEANGVDPRAAPESVPDLHVTTVPQSVEGTSERPRAIAATLEGTAAQATTVEVFALDEGALYRTPGWSDDIKSGKSLQKWYSLGAGQVITVGGVTVLTVPCVPGTLYFRTTTNPAAAAVLKLAFI